MFKPKSPLKNMLAMAKKPKIKNPTAGQMPQVQDLNPVAPEDEMQDQMDPAPGTVDPKQKFKKLKMKFSSQ